MSKKENSQAPAKNEQTMTSREIANVSGKPHNDVLKAIRNMESAWEKVTGGNFSLSEYKDSSGRKLPMYKLTQRECLYIAAKFNDETRAKLVLRWEELELINQAKQQNQRPQSESIYNDSNYCKSSQWRHRNGLLPKKKREDADFLDLRSTPFETVLFLGEPVRMIIFEDEEYYSVIDIRKALKITTDTGAMVRNLNAKEPLARKIFIFGATNPGWFCTSNGFKLLACGRTSAPFCIQKVLEMKGGLLCE